MKIAMIVRGYLPVPRPKDIIYAPIDIAIEVASGLVKRGHEVDFFAPRGSELETTVKNLGLKPLVHNQKEWEKFLHNTDLHMHYVPYLWDYFFAEQMFIRAERGEYDLLHFHHPEVAMTLARRYPTVKVAYTLHDPLFSWYTDIFKMYASPNQHFISISDNQRLPQPNLNYAATVYNGVNTDEFRPNGKVGDYLLFAGRIVPEKGVKDAVKIAQATNMPLIIAGPIFPDNRVYFNKYIKPHLNEKIRYVGYIDRDKLLSYYQKAKAMLMPIRWEEPFGRTIIESMACGAPIIAIGRGSIPEIVVDKKTGFVVKSVKEMIDAVGKLDTIDRKDCRKHVVDHFSNQKMINSYEAAFKKILAA